MAKVVITRDSNDPICLRASIGGTPDMGYYLWFRGDPDQVGAMLREVLDAFEKVPDGAFQPPS